jgi:HEAT repeat protein
VRRVLIVIWLLLVAAALALTILDPDPTLTHSVQAAVVIVSGLMIFSWVLGLFKPRRAQPPRSQIAEIERLYFRAMREMLTDSPNYAQVINDLQRILSIDPGYKNARHYLNRAMILRQENNPQPNGARSGSKADFYHLQEKLIDLDPTVRKSVVMELIQYGEVAVDPLIALLMDEDADVRVHAATALGWVGGKDAVQPLLVALQDENLGVRRYAARALCWVVDETAVPGLIEALHDEDNYVRCYSARALGWSQDERAIEPLKVLLGHENADVRSYATTALEDLGQGDAVKAITA